MLTPNQLKWVEALESGRFPQTRNVLTAVGPDGPTGHCCLGVACELFIEEGGDLRADDVDNEREYIMLDGAGFANRYSSFLPPIVAEWLGIPGIDNPMVGALAASTLNDSHRLTFAEIAERVRKYGLR